MGYRSEVAIKCEEKAYKLFEEVFLERELYIMPDKIYKDGDDYILYWEWAKWYECYEGVQAIIDVMNDLDDCGNKDGGYGYKFMRIGEDDNDTETRSNDWNIELWMIRKIDIPDELEELESN